MKCFTHFLHKYTFMQEFQIQKKKNLDFAQKKKLLQFFYGIL